MARPTIKTPEIIDELCERLSNGEPLAKICADAHMPCFRSIYGWEQSDPEFLQVSARAREVGTNKMADDCLLIADSAEGDVQDRRLRIDTRLRLIGKWNRKIYGDKLDANVDANVSLVVEVCKFADSKG